MTAVGMERKKKRERKEIRRGHLSFGLRREWRQELRCVGTEGQESRPCRLHPTERELQEIRTSIALLEENMNGSRRSHVAVLFAGEGSLKVSCA